MIQMIYTTKDGQKLSVTSAELRLVETIYPGGSVSRIKKFDINKVDIPIKKMKFSV
jgi:hypothetical protein